MNTLPQQQYTLSTIILQTPKVANPKLTIQQCCHKDFVKASTTHVSTTTRNCTFTQGNLVERQRP
jgi:hypothetical protein